MKNIIFLACVFSCFVSGALQGGALEFGDPARFAVRFNDHTGLLTEIVHKGETVTLPNQPVQFFDIMQDDHWIFGKSKLELVGIERQPPAVHVTYRLGDWTVLFRYIVGNATLSWNAELTYNGTEPTKIKGFWRAFPTLPFDNKDAEFFVPGQYPPRKYNPDNFAEGARQWIGRNSTPLVFQLDSSKSVIMLSDQLIGYGDRPGGDVSRRDGGLRLVQSFDTKGHVKPRVTQYVGVGYLRMVDGDGETALTKIHDLMREIGHVVPKDRPQWFESAILYSFHPGGTIGSNFRDLGGFTAAMPLLDRIKELGCNSIWIMPIEDYSVYWPRDYYQFQAGLGTPEEYKALVARAHELGLKVLQDNVPHGGSNKYQRMIDHPEWLAQAEDGSTLHYWCADFNEPTWIEYMSEVARHYVREFGVDGFRVDACGGSKIPNWNPDIPYARASHSQSQGGLNMLRGLRSAVKELKPEEGGILAEVQGSIFGAVSDAVYDFDMCYNVLHDSRKHTAEEFVNRLRRWLHEQQYSEIPDLLRLRHVESHDSLRGQLWYGTKAHRKLVALTTFIHGIPLVYHEQEDGNSENFMRLFDLRNALPELQGGDADYLCVNAPPGVFAVLRTKGDNASIITIDFNDKPSEFELQVPFHKLPAALQLQSAVVLDAARGYGEGISNLKIVDGNLHLPKIFPRRAWVESVNYFVFRQGIEGLMELGLEDIAFGLRTPRMGRESQSATSSVVPLQLAPPVVFIDTEDGLPAQLLYETRFPHLGLLEKADIFLPPGYREKAETPQVVRKENKLTVTQKFGNATLELIYTDERDKKTDSPLIRMTSRWTGTDIPENAAISFPVPVTTPAHEYWRVATPWENVLENYRPRHLTTDGVYSSIYWRPQGTNVVFDSLLSPFHPSFFLNFFAVSPLSMQFDDPIPARVRILDRIGEKKGLSLLVSWTDDTTPRLSLEPALTLYLCWGHPDQSTIKPLPHFRTTIGGWIYENDHYRLRIARNGTITSLDHSSGTPVLLGCDIYTDYGYGSGDDEKMRYGASNDVEAACRIIQDGDTLRLRFEGQLRGFGRFDLLRPPVEYFVEYALNESAAFGLSYGVKTSRQPTDGRAFLGAMFPLPDVETFEYFRDGKSVATGSNVNATGRSQESRINEVDGVVLKSADQVLLQLSGINGDGKLFLDRKNFFMVYDDGNATGPPNRWRTFSAMVSTNDSPVSRLTLRDVVVPEESVAQGEAALVIDGGFERSFGNDLISLRTGAVLKGTAKQHAPWQIPLGGSIDVAEKHSGNVSAKVVGEKGEYRLFAQDMDAKRFPVGTKLKLSAFVKGEAIEKAVEPWQVGCVRFAALVDGQMRYIASPELLGSFDWKQITVELTVPEKLERLTVQIGLNGASGVMWIDDVTLE